MTKADVLAKLEEYKDRPIEIGLSDEGAMLYSGIEGHWLFTQGDNLIEVRKNTSDGTYGFDSINQNQTPFVVTVVQFDTVNYVKTHIKNEAGDIQKIIGSFEPVATDKSLDDIIKSIQSDSIRKAQSPRGNLNTPDVNTKGSYGKFSGTIISTEIDGIPNYMKEDLLSNNDKNN